MTIETKPYMRHKHKIVTVPSEYFHVLMKFIAQKKGFPKLH
jgi:hypothetical protein